MCVFCEIIKGSIPSAKIYEDEKILAIKDINPVAPVHTIIFPKEHIENINALNADNSDVVAHIFEKMSHIAKIQGEESYRVISNCGEDAGQTVLHMHFHLIAGEKLGEKII